MLNIEEFDIKLDTDVIGRNFIYCQEVESTNLVLLNGKDYDKNGTVLLSEFQTKGRGRRNRTWDSIKEMNLTFSILLNEKIDQRLANLYNLGSSLAVAQAIENLYQLSVRLKWPNDVLINDKKIAGILLDSVSKGNKLEKVVIGIGINVNQPMFGPDYSNYTPTSVRLEFRQHVSRERLLSEVLNNFEIIINTIKEEPEQILEDWKTKSRLLGERVKIEENGEVKVGIFEDLDEMGYIILRTGRVTEKIVYGDVSLGLD